MAGKQASTKRTSLMLGNDSDETQLVWKTFYSWRDEQRLESNVQLTKLFPMTTQADRSDGLKVCDDSKTKLAGLSPSNWSHENTTKDHMFPRYPPSPPLVTFYLHGHTAFNLCLGFRFLFLNIFA